MEDIRGGGDAAQKHRKDTQGKGPKDKENRARREKEDKAVYADMDEVERRHYSTGKHTVEVSVKLKKRRSRSREKVKEKERTDPVKVTDTGYRKGSWGDLLTRMKSDPTRREIAPSRERLKEKTDHGDKERECCRKKSDTRKEKSTEAILCCVDGANPPKSLCRKIPISSDLYLETHTHILPRDKSKKDEHKHREKEKARERPVIDIDDRLEEMSHEEKVATFLGVKKNAKSSSETLRLENEALRSEASELLAQMQQARKEQQESIMTIKELYQLAELLKKENQKLVGTHDEQQHLADKLLSAKNENEQLREYVQALLKMQNASKYSQSDHMSRLEQLRNVIQEVKSTIQEEIEGITTSDKPEPLAFRETLRGFDMNLSDLEDSALLNDTNASEIQKILGSYENSGASVAESIASRAYLSPPPPPEEVSLRSPASVQHKTSTPGQPRARVFRSVDVEERTSFKPIREFDKL